MHTAPTDAPRTTENLDFCEELKPSPPPPAAKDRECQKCKVR